MRGGKFSNPEICAVYFITAHSSYYDDKKITFNPNITLDFFASKDECLYYEDSFLHNICPNIISKKLAHKKTIGTTAKHINIRGKSLKYRKINKTVIIRYRTKKHNPKNSYSPVYSVKNQYYQMGFAGEYDEDHSETPMCVYCCNTDEFIYKFYDETTKYLHKDLYLNDIIELIELHNRVKLQKPNINISLLGCNGNSYVRSNVEITRKLRSTERKNEIVIKEGNNTKLSTSRALTKSRKKSLSQIKDEMPLLREAEPIIKHHLKQYDSVLIFNWETLITDPFERETYIKTITEEYWIILSHSENVVNAEGNQRTKWFIRFLDQLVDTSDLYYYSPIFDGDYVMYQNSIYRVLSTTCHNYSYVTHTIVNIDNGTELNIDNNRLIKIFFNL
jgi:hypothetical protein